jgi:hypothetical protein
MTKCIPEQRTTAANEARRRRTEESLERIKAVVAAMGKERSPITVQAVARRAGVSRTFCYQRPEVRQLIAAAAGRATQTRHNVGVEAAAAAEMAWRERALNAEARLRDTTAEIHSQRRQIGELLGRIRDLELDLPADSVQRLVTENTTLKQRINTLTSENRTLTERLAAARENTRSQDRIISQFQAQILDQQPHPGRHLRAVHDEGNRA